MSRFLEILTEEQKAKLKDVYYILNRKMYAIVPEKAAPTKDTLIVIVLDNSKEMLELKAKDFKKDEDGNFEWSEEGCYINEYNIPAEVLAILSNNEASKVEKN